MCIIREPSEIIYACYVQLLCLCLVDFLCARISCKIQNPRTRENYCRTHLLCEDSIVLPYGSIAVVSFVITTGAIVVMDCFAMCIFASESVIASVFLLGELGGVLIKFIKRIVGLLITFSFIVVPKRHPHPFLLPPS